MSDKQTTALVLLFLLALTFWLYNSGKLKPVVDAIIAPPGTGSLNYNGGYNEQGKGYDFGGDGTYLPPPSGVKSPIMYNFDPSQLNYSGNEGFYNKLNTIDLYNAGSVIQYLMPTEGPLPSRIGSYS